MTELSATQGQCNNASCPNMGATVNVWPVEGHELCYQCLKAAKEYNIRPCANAGHLWGNARTQPTQVGERHYASATEARCALWLQLRERAGEIRNLEYQAPYVLAEPVPGVHRGVKAVIDFRFELEGPDNRGIFSEWRVVLLDAKAVGKPDANHKRPWYVSLTDSARVKYIWLYTRYGLHVKLWPALEEG